MIQLLRKKAQLRLLKLHSQNGGANAKAVPSERATITDLLGLFMMLALVLYTSLESPFLKMKRPKKMRTSRRQLSAIKFNFPSLGIRRQYAKPRTRSA